MEHSLPLISTLVIAFSLALVLGFAAERFFKAPALVGYLLAGIAAGKYTPGVFADPALANQLSELGVMLLMFGVGLHFSMKDLLKVKGIAVPGAVLQMFIATLLGGVAAHFFWGWHWGDALVLGMCLSCASTVVRLKALEVRGILQSMDGQIAVGWLVVEDIATVLILVLLPPLAGLLTGGAAGGTGTVVTGKDILIQIAWTIGNVAAFIAVMLVVGRRVLPWAMTQVARTGSRELFTLFVLAAAVGVAYGASAIFNVSFALGAFFAGMVMRESSFAHRAATESLPLQDAFCVLFFVGVGMLFDWHIIIEAPLQVLTVLLIIMVGKAMAAFGLVHMLKYPLHTAVTVSASLAQIGEFSFILVAQAKELGLADDYAVNLIVGAAILSIALNPVVFSLIPEMKKQLTSRWAWARKAAMREAPFETLPEETDTKHLSDQIVVTGEGALMTALMPALSERGLPLVAVLQNHETAKTLSDAGISVIVGNPTDPQTLVSSHLMNAQMLMILDNSTESLRVAEVARTLKNDIAITIVAPDPGIWVDVPGFSSVRFVSTVTAAAATLAGDLEKASGEGAQIGTVIERHIKKQVTAQLDDAEAVREQVAAEELARAQKSAEAEKAAETEAGAKSDASPAEPAAETAGQAEPASPEAAAAPPEEKPADVPSDRPAQPDAPSEEGVRTDAATGDPTAPDLRSRATGLFSLFSRKKKN